MSITYVNTTVSMVSVIEVLRNGRLCVKYLTCDLNAHNSIKFQRAHVIGYGTLVLFVCARIANSYFLQWVEGKIISHGGT